MHIRGHSFIPKVAAALQAGGTDLQKCIDACKRNYETCKLLADAQYEVRKARCEADWAKVSAGCLLFPHPPDREKCLRLAEAGKRICLAGVSVGPVDGGFCIKWSCTF